MRLITSLVCAAGVLGGSLAIANAAPIAPTSAVLTSSDAGVTQVKMSKKKMMMMKKKKMMMMKKKDM